ncbi:hypothetical protein [Eastern grey kangaroopox virus]|uniref:Uncharacterized protein n=1 Tax=Eastern grey kangaroopox virus TaxID=2042482 RepID=A0A2C9DT46_9POXV|nr:hypothetical protein KM541_gp083 [Eastern grey kangaroopox virus]ATI21179.1 hypothetical protein [Eastern grey kangaroopox virus]ATX75085.1 hypothetical protein EKPV-NSW-ORF097 [Eastern grey kangaroopox virus]
MTLIAEMKVIVRALGYGERIIDMPGDAELVDVVDCAKFAFALVGEVAVHVSRGRYGVTLHVRPAGGISTPQPSCQGRAIRRAPPHK